MLKFTHNMFFELEIKDTTDTGVSASYLDIHLESEN